LSCKADIEENSVIIQVCSVMVYFVVKNIHLFNLKIAALDKTVMSCSKCHSCTNYSLSTSKSGVDGSILPLWHVSCFQHEWNCKMSSQMWILQKTLLLLINL